jgi:hypothetical protein
LPAITLLTWHPIDDFCFDNANTSRQRACRSLNARDSGEYRRFRNADRPGVESIVRPAAALEEQQLWGGTTPCSGSD